MRTIVIAAALAALGAPAHAEPSSETTSAVRYATQLAQGRACGWLGGPTEPMALELTMKEQVVFALVKGGEAARAETQAAVDAALKAPKPCADADRGAVQSAARYAEDDWVIRSVALLDAEARQPFAAGLSAVAGQEAVLRARFASLPESRTSLFKKIRDANAEAAVRRMCPERKAVRWPRGQRPCPAPLADDAKLLVSSRLFVEGAESFAPLYDPPVAPVTSGRSIFGVGPGHPLYVASGDPIWRVYNDCSWAYYDAADAAGKAKASATPGIVNSGQMNTLIAAGSAMDLIEMGEVFTDKAVTAYAAETGKRRAEVEKFVKDADATRKLTTNQCAALR